MDLSSSNAPWQWKVVSRINASWQSTIVVLVLVFVAGTAAHALFASVVLYPARYAATALFGALVGTTELVSRYRDRPTAPLGSWPGLIYIATNVGASVIALWLLQRQDVKFDFGGSLPPELSQVLLAGFGTMIFFAARFLPSALAIRTSRLDLPPCCRSS